MNDYIPDTTNSWLVVFHASLDDVRIRAYRIVAWERKQCDEEICLSPMVLLIYRAVSLPEDWKEISCIVHASSEEDAINQDHERFQMLEDEAILKYVESVLFQTIPGYSKKAADKVYEVTELTFAGYIYPEIDTTRRDEETVRQGIDRLTPMIPRLISKWEEYIKEAGGEAEQ